MFSRAWVAKGAIAFTAYAWMGFFVIQIWQFSGSVIVSESAGELNGTSASRFRLGRGGSIRIPGADRIFRRGLPDVDDTRASLGKRHPSALLARDNELDIAAVVQSWIAVVEAEDHNALTSLGRRVPTRKNALQTGETIMVGKKKLRSRQHRALKNFSLAARQTRTYLVIRGDESHKKNGAKSHPALLFEHRLRNMGYRSHLIGRKRGPWWLLQHGQRCPSWNSLVEAGKQIVYCAHLWVHENPVLRYKTLGDYAKDRPGINAIIRPQSFFKRPYRLHFPAERAMLHNMAEKASKRRPHGRRPVHIIIHLDNNNKDGRSKRVPQLTSKIAVDTKKWSGKKHAVAFEYLNAPFLWSGRKFVTRAIALVISIKPFIVLYHDGPQIRSLHAYEPYTGEHANNVNVGLHFPALQEFTNPNFHKYRNRVYAPIDELSGYMSQSVADDGGSALRKLIRPRIRQATALLLYALRASVAYKTVPSKIVLHQHICFDFVVAEDYHVELEDIDTNCNLNFGGSGFQPKWKVGMIDVLVDTSIELAEEMIFRKSRKREIRLNLMTTNTKSFTTLIDESLRDFIPTNAQEIERVSRLAA